MEIYHFSGTIFGPFSSLSSKKCLNIVNGERCRKGWHIKGTVPDHNNISGNINGSTTNYGTDFQNFQNQQGSHNNQNQDFLLNMVRREMGIVLREIFQTLPSNPQSGRDYLWALMGNKRT